MLQFRASTRLQLSPPCGVELPCPAVRGDGHAPNGNGSVDRANARRPWTRIPEGDFSPLLAVGLRQYLLQRIISTLPRILLFIYFILAESPEVNSSLLILV